MSRPLLAWCPPCNKEQPTVRKGLRARRHCMVCHEPVLSLSKYQNVPTKSRFSIGRNGKPRVFQSKKEANREPVLLALRNVGEITDLQYQVPFRLELYGTQAVDALLAAIEEWIPKFPTGGTNGLFSRLTKDVRRSRQCVAVYKADFTYRTKAGELVVEDPKGYVKAEYRMKKKLMVLAHNVEIQEPGEGGVQQRARGAGISGRGTGSRLMGGGR